jgi:hypothetical protein
MIPPDAALSIQLIPLYCIQVRECQMRYPPRLTHYIDLLLRYPEDYPGVLSVQPSDTHAGMYTLLDGFHRFCALIICGRSNAFCVVIEERPREAHHDRH